MGKILIGLAIALLDFPLQLGGGRMLDLTPDLLGYIFVIFGLREIGRYSLKFASAYKVSYFATISSGAVFAVSLLVGQENMSMVIVLLGIAEMILQILLMVFLAAGFRDMEQDFDIGMQSKWLKIVAIGIALGIALGYAGVIVPELEIVGSLMVDILHFAYLILFYFAWEAYKTWLLKEE